MFDTRLPVFQQYLSVFTKDADGGMADVIRAGAGDDFVMVCMRVVVEAGMGASLYLGGLVPTLRLDNPVPLLTTGLAAPQGEFRFR